MQDSTVIKMNKDLQNQVKALEGRIESMDRLMRGSLLVMRDYDSQLLTLKDLLFKANILKEDEYNVQADVRRGLRLVEAGEKIKAGDIVWVKYQATAVIEGAVQTIAEDEELPVRVGSNAITFETALVNRTIGDNVTFTTQVQDEGPLKGQDITFSITVLKAKTKTGEANAESESGDGTTVGTNQPGTDNRTVIELGGHTDQEQHAGSDTVVQQGRSGDAGPTSNGGIAAGASGLGNGGQGVSGVKESDPHSGLPKTVSGPALEAQL